MSAAEASSYGIDLGDPERERGFAECFLSMAMETELAARALFDARFRTDSPSEIEYKFARAWSN